MKKNPVKQASISDFVNDIQAECPFHKVDVIRINALSIYCPVFSRTVCNNIAFLLK